MTSNGGKTMNKPLKLIGRSLWFVWRVTWLCVAVIGLSVLALAIAPALTVALLISEILPSNRKDDP